MSASRIKRPSRTRTARTNGRPILSLSTIPAQDINLLPGETSLVCRDCETWCPITGLQTPKTTPHPRPAQQGGHRCPGGNQLLNLDVTFDEWREQLQAVEATAAYRRAPRQHHKPVPQPPTPVHRLADRESKVQSRLPQLLERARCSVLTHRNACPACQTGGRCVTGRELEIRLGETQASCEIAREQMERQERRTARQQAAPSVREAQWAEHGGEAVEKANNSCTTRALGSLSEFRGPGLPMLPQDVEAHDRRQAELGRQYARKAPAA
ncbi:hypothetical protein [Streptomyces sp. NBC_00342]|uniref:hypothetical protein n=1 Tax=Streptomyces sp. NBC_00342 TaxID=2975718 RepID=UPI002E2A7EFE|nr:hypothetical protein [Streptomyces sp. NBC_00342]